MDHHENRDPATMTAQNGYASYSVSSARYASPGIQVAMLLAAAARHMETARECMTAGDIEGRFNATEKCAAIVSGLRGCLNREDTQAAPMTQVLEDYYSRLLTFLTQINVRNDLQLCGAVADSLRAMSSTWREIQARADAEARASLTTPAASPLPSATAGPSGLGDLSA